MSLLSAICFPRRLVLRHDDDNHYPYRAHPDETALYRQGLGYRAVARELRGEGISVDWSTIRRVVKAETRQGDGQEWL